MTITLLDIPGVRQLLTREPSFASAVKSMATSLGLDFNAILGVMSLESGLKPEATNPTSKATGLIQFMPATARGLGTTVDALRGMSAVEQLEYVKRFFAPHQNKIREVGDYYMAVFMPAYLGAPRETVLGEKGSTEILKFTNVTKGKIYDQNAGLDVNKDGKITVGDVMQKNEARIAAASQKPALEVADVPLVATPPSVAPPSSLPPAWRSSGGPSDLPVLRLGARGTAVTMAQVLLGCDVITGVYTEAMLIDYVRPFQIAAGLAHDGVIGRITWQALSLGLSRGTAG